MKVKMCFYVSSEGPNPGSHDGLPIILSNELSPVFVILF